MWNLDVVKADGLVAFDAGQVNVSLMMEFRTAFFQFASAQTIFLFARAIVNMAKDVERYQLVHRELPSDDFPCHVLMGVRRAGKSFMLFQKMQEMLAGGHGWNEMLYLNFEDDRLALFLLK